jgi:hypothetical protein
MGGLDTGGFFMSKQFIHVREGDEFLNILGVKEVRIVTEDHGTSDWILSMVRLKGLLRDAFQRGIFTADMCRELEAEALGAGLLGDFSKVVKVVSALELPDELKGDWAFRVCQRDDCGAVKEIVHGSVFKGEEEIFFVTKLGDLFRKLRDMVLDGEEGEHKITAIEAAHMLKAATEADLPVGFPEIEKRFWALPDEVIGRVLRQAHEHESRVKVPMVGFIELPGGIGFGISVDWESFFGHDEDQPDDEETTNPIEEAVKLLQTIAGLDAGDDEELYIRAYVEKVGSEVALVSFQTAHDQSPVRDLSTDYLQQIESTIRTLSAPAPEPSSEEPPPADIPPAGAPAEPVATSPGDGIDKE